MQPQQPQQFQLYTPQYPASSGYEITTPGFQRQGLYQSAGFEDPSTSGQLIVKEPLKSLKGTTNNGKITNKNKKTLYFVQGDLTVVKGSGSPTGGKPSTVKPPFHGGDKKPVEKKESFQERLKRAIVMFNAGKVDDALAMIKNIHPSYKNASYNPQLVFTCDGTHFVVRLKGDTLPDIADIIAMFFYIKSKCVSGVIVASPEEIRKTIRENGIPSGGRPMSLYAPFLNVLFNVILRFNSSKDTLHIDDVISNNHVVVRSLERDRFELLLPIHERIQSLAAEAGYVPDQEEAYPGPSRGKEIDIDHLFTNQ